MPILTLGLALGIPALAWYASRAILESTDGTLQVAITDPSAPGFETLVIPTPSHMLFAVDGQGALTMVAVMSLASNDEGGTVLLIPPETLVDDTTRLADVHGSEGREAARTAVAALLGADTDALSVLDPAGWTQFTAAAAPLTVTLTEPLFVAEGEGERQVVYEAGATAVAASQVGEITSWLSPGEDPFNRLIRQRLFWESWVAKIVETGPQNLPGEADSGLRRMLTGLAAAQSRFLQVPLRTMTSLPDGSPAFAPIEDELEDIAVDMLPFPLPSAPGARVRVRLLDGVGGLDVASRFTPELVRAGAQIVVIGNAGQFGVQQTSIVYHDPALIDRAQALADAVGGARLSHDPVSDAVLDLTVVIGADRGLVTG